MMKCNKCGYMSLKGTEKACPNCKTPLNWETDIPFKKEETSKETESSKEKTYNVPPRCRKCNCELFNPNAKLCPKCKGKKLRFWSIACYGVGPAILVIGLFYRLGPIDIIPDTIPIAGIIDDIIIGGLCGIGAIILLISAIVLGILSRKTKK